MINWLHTNIPHAVLINLGPIQVYWYGFLFVVGVILAMVTATKLAKNYNLGKEVILDLSFWLIIFGLIGARFYHVGLEYQYYLAHPLDIIKIWNGGLAIHGGIIAGILVLWFFAKKRAINFWQLTAIIAPGLALAQAIGRWGNYFNQELYGKVTDLPWGIPIYGSNVFYHPTFIYESIGNFVIFLILLAGHYYYQSKQKWLNLVIGYLIMYSLLRFSLEFLRLDATPVLGGWRWPQIISIIIILACLSYMVYHWFNRKKLKKV